MALSVTGSGVGSGGGGGGNDGDDRRYKPSLPGILKFCTDQTDEDRDSVPRETMSDERREFLQNALASIQTEDPIRVMLEDIDIAMAPGETEEDLEKKEAALEDLQIHCEDMDLANDFHKIGGYKLLFPLLESSLPGIRWRTGDLIATMAQNNVYSQQCLLDAEIIPALVRTLDTDNADLPRVKALYAISCIVRDFPLGQDAFVDKADGFSVLVRAMQSDVEKLQLKASFLLGSLCQNQPKYKDTLVSMGILEQLVALLHGVHAGYHEHLMRALLVLSTDHQGAQAGCRRPELQLHQLLEDRIHLLEGKEEYQEERDSASQLLNMCFQGTSGVDR